MNVHFSTKSSEWETPTPLFNKLNEEFGFTLDPCATRENAKCPKFYTQRENGLVQLWDGETVFMNPPYGSAIKAWMRKAFLSSQKGATVVCLVPARTDTSWWHKYAVRGDIRFIRGRLKFNGHRSNAPFPSAIVVFRPACPISANGICGIGRT